MTATTTSRTTTTQPPVRVSRLPGAAPASAQPDTTPAWEVPPTQGALALVLEAPPRDRPEERPVLALVDDVDGGDDFEAPRPTRAADLPDPTRWSAQLACAAVEVLAGARPAAQLLRWTTPEVHAGLVRRAAVAQRARATRLTGPAPSARRRPAVVRAVRTCAPTDGVVEASVVVLDRGRVRAVALRLEGLDGRWRATALDVV